MKDTNDKLYSNFTDGLDQTGNEMVKKFNSINFGFYLWKHDYDKKEDVMIFRIPGRSVGGIKIDYETNIIKEVAFNQGGSEFCGISESYLKSWIGKELIVREER